MVKLVAVRSNRMYGPRQSQGAFELVNAVVYMVATLLLLGGFILLLPGFINHDHPQAALIVLTIALCLIIIVNLHDLSAQVAGIDFRLGLLAYDPQLALIEVGAPLVYTIGGMLFLIAVIFMLKSKTLGLGGRQGAALRLLIAGSVLWLLGSLHNAFQVYERASLAVQLYQKAVYLPLLISCTLYLVSSILWMKSWPHFVVGQRAQYAAATMAIIASVLMVIGAIANISRVIYLRKLVRASALSSSCAALDRLRGGAHEELERGHEGLERGHRHEREPLLEQEPPAAAPVPIVESEDTFAVIRRFEDTTMGLRDVDLPLEELQLNGNFQTGKLYNTNKMVFGKISFQAYYSPASITSEAASLE